MITHNISGARSWVVMMNYVALLYHYYAAQKDILSAVVGIMSELCLNRVSGILSVIPMMNYFGIQNAFCMFM